MEFEVDRAWVGLCWRLGTWKRSLSQGWTCHHTCAHPSNWPCGCWGALPILTRGIPERDCCTASALAGPGVAINYAGGWIFAAAAFFATSTRLTCRFLRDGGLQTHCARITSGAKPRLVCCLPPVVSMMCVCVRRGMHVESRVYWICAAHAAIGCTKVLLRRGWLVAGACGC